MSRSKKIRWMWHAILGVFAAVILILAILPITGGIKIGSYGIDADAFVDGEILDSAKVSQGFSFQRYPAGRSPANQAYREFLVLRTGVFAYQLFYGRWGTPGT